MARIAWQDARTGEAYKATFATGKAIRDQQRLQRFDMVSYLELYSAGNVSGMGRTLNDYGSGYYTGRSPRGSNLRGGKFNMGAAVVDSAHSLIAANPPIPIYITSGVDLATVRKAERKSKVLQSQMNELASDCSREAFHMACKTGTGVVYGYLENGEARLEAVNPLELLVDHQDGFYRQPKSMHRVRYVHKAVLRAMYPSKAAAIDKASVSYEDYVASFFMTGIGATDEMCEVIESWYLGTGFTTHRDGSQTPKPGRHVVAISTCDLRDEDFADTEFPFAVVRYRNRAFGFYGAGLIEAVRENQNRVNQLIRRVAKAQDLASNLMIFNPNGEGSLNPEWLTNEIGLIFNYNHDVGMPQLQKWDGTLGDLQAQIDLEFERVLRVEGLSESQVSGEGAGKGLTSGVAVRAQDDVMSRRLINPVTLFQRFNIDIARLLERLNDRAAERDPNYTAKGFLSDAGRTFLKSSRWADLEIEDGMACLNMMPMSIMPTTPAGKWAAIQEWIQASFIDKTGAMKLLQFPAIDETASLETAQMDLVLYQLESVLDGKQVLPMERQDLALVLKIGTMAWAKAQMMNPTLDVQDAFDAYLDYADQLMKSAAPTAAPAGMDAGLPGAAGAPPAPAAPMGGIAAAPIVQQMAA